MFKKIQVILSWEPLTESDLWLQNQLVTNVAVYIINGVGYTSFSSAGDRYIYNGTPAQLKLDLGL